MGIVTQDVYLPVNEWDPNIVGDYISTDGRSMCRMELKTNMAVLTKEQLTSIVLGAMGTAYDIGLSGANLESAKQESTEYVENLFK